MLVYVFSPGSCPASSASWVLYLAAQLGSSDHHGALSLAGLACRRNRASRGTVGPSPAPSSITDFGITKISWPLYPCLPQAAEEFYVYRYTALMVCRPSPPCQASSQAAGLRGRQAADGPPAPDHRIITSSADRWSFAGRIRCRLVSNSPWDHSQISFRLPYHLHVAVRGTRLREAGSQHHRAERGRLVPSQSTR